MNMNKAKITEIPYDLMENVPDLDLTEEAFEFWFTEDEYGSFGSTREMYFISLVDLAPIQHIEMMKRWVKAAFEVGYIVGKYGVQRSQEESPPKEEANREAPIRDNSLD